MIGGSVPLMMMFTVYMPHDRTALATADALGQIIRIINSRAPFKVTRVIPDDEKEFIINKYNEIHNQGFLPRLNEFIERAQSIKSNISNKLLAFTYSVNLDLTSFEGLKRHI